MPEIYVKKAGHEWPANLSIENELVTILGAL